MKKLFLTLAISLGIFASAAAQDGGRMWIGGSVGFDHEKTKRGDAENKVTSFNILPEFGYFINENFAIAGRLGYRHTKTEEGDVSSKDNAFVVNPFVRYTFLKGSIGGLFVDGGIRAAFGKENDETLTEYGVGFRPGAIVNIGNGFALTATFGWLGYDHKEVKYEPKEKTDKFGLDFDMGELTMGIIYTF